MFVPSSPSLRIPPFRPCVPAGPATVRCSGNTRNTRGFTLIELIFVLVVLAVLVGIALPALEGSAAGQGGRDTAAMLLALTNQARSQAVAEGVTYRLVLDVPGRSYYLSKQAGTDFVPLVEEVGRPHLLPEGVELSYEDASALQQLQQADATGQILPVRPPSDLPYVDFQPSGRIDPAVIVVTNQRDQSVRRLVCPSPAETFRIVDATGQIKY